MKQLDLENFECNIGLMAREKGNHDNYVLFRMRKLSHDDSVSSAFSNLKKKLDELENLEESA